jgi:hypothetical protein
MMPSMAARDRSPFSLATTSPGLALIPDRPDKILARKNLLLATDTLATQSVTLPAFTHTLSFTGSGTITLTGASTAGPLVGGGSLTFAPTAGSVTFTVTGTVTFAQLERGPTATAYQKITDWVTEYSAVSAGRITCYQDSAGTVPVTGVEQPVGKILDRSGRGNHATQPTSAARPILSALYNAVLYSEQFDNAIWVKTSATITANFTLAPDGCTTADLLTITGAGIVRQDPGVGVVAGAKLFVCVHLKYDTSQYVQVSYRSSAFTGLNAVVNFDLVNGTYSGAVGVADVTITAVANGFYKCGFSVTAIGADTTPVFIIAIVANSTAGYGEWVAGSVVVWGAQSIKRDVNLPYQATTASGTYDSVGFPTYLRFDNIDDKLITGNVDLTASDKLSIWASGLYNNNAANIASNGVIGTDHGIFQLGTYSGSGGSSLLYCQASGSFGARTVPVNIPARMVQYATIDLAGTTNATEIPVQRINGTQPAFTDYGAPDSGTGNFRNAPITLGVMNANFQGLVIRGGLTPAAESTLIERYMAEQLGVKLP